MQSLPITSCVTLGKLVNLSGLLFLDLEKEEVGQELQGVL